ncbi:F-box-like/WD repeat-containing protein [Lachnellula occidentalis]|uniref:F-box-like/WD repeat-containing protein n=1 Tax=Lachnellula occidentalis TaxID=215460 RepID=A0A8H8S3T6_9HELO|nr:F-box-like/WD repeat-containing protein [Lachnellula occidentalis]
MAKETLDSDRVNYMIWRYLIESGYEESAVRLQKEWNHPDPQQLSCAPHVPNHALVALLNRGLMYAVNERENLQVRIGEAGTVAGFFGPLTPTSPPAEAAAAPATGEENENARKRTIDHEQAQTANNGPPAKRSRHSNGGYENGFDPTAMDVDEEPPHGDENAYPSPEQLPSPVIATIGPDQGTQIEKVSELSTETIFLELSDDPASRNAVLLQCEWNPRDPKILAAAGTDALARMWTLSRTAAEPDADTDTDTDPEMQQQQQKPLFQPHHTLLDADALPSTQVTGLSWSSDGEAIAVASEPMEEGTAKIEFWDQEGNAFASFNTFESPVIFLRWNLSNQSCLALSTENEGKGTMITVMYPGENESTRYSLPTHSLHEQDLDAAWTDIEEFVLCGGDYLQTFQIMERVISPGRKYETQEGHALSKITYDWRSRLFATASTNGIIDIWDYKGHCQSLNAHQGQITALLWQPIPVPAALRDDSERLLASAGEDGAISIWNARSLETKCRSSMTMGSAVACLAFSPDGAFIAGGTSERIFIWKVDDPTLPRATWIGCDQLGWRTPQSQDSVAEETQYCLSWDSNGQKLAYGFNTSVCDFDRKTKKCD